MSKELQEAVGRTVRLARLARGLSQEALAELSGLDRTYISGLERGLRNPSLASVEKIALALELSVTEFFASLSQ